MSKTPPELLDQATIDLIFALRDSLTEASPNRIDFWNGRAASKEILSLTSHTPLFGHTSGKQAKTHWIAFMKGESP